jgi:hypothetical protein
MQPRHCAGLDAAVSPRTHHQVVARAELIDELAQVGQVVRFVGIGHYDEAPASLLDPVSQCVSIASIGFSDDSRAGAPRDLRRAITGSIVDYHYFAGDPQTLHSFQSLDDTGAYGIRFIQAWQDYR